MSKKAHVLSKEDSLALYRRLLGYLKPLWPAAIISIIGFAMFASTNFWFVDLTGQLVDTIAVAREITLQERLRIPLLLVLLAATRGIGGYLGGYSMAYIANTVVHHMRSQLLERFLQLPVKFYDRSEIGKLMSTVTYNVIQIASAVSDSLKVLLQQGLTVVGLLGYMLYQSWQLTLIFIAALPLIAALISYASKLFRKYSHRIQSSIGDVTHILSETIKGIRVIRSFGAEKQALDNFTEASGRSRSQGLKLESVSNISTPVIQVVVTISLAIMVWLVLSPQMIGNLSTGDLTSFIVAAGMLSTPIRQLTQVNSAIQRGLAAASSIFELLDEDIEANNGTYESKRVEGRLSFKSLSFRYQENAKDVLNDINFEASPGQVTAIVGKSGSGKTTLVNLIPRFYDVTQGQILIDDVANTDYTLNNLRQQIALVSQQIILFNSSVRENVAYGELSDKSEEEIMEALRSAHALKFIEELPQGLDTIVGDDATLLSGGQRQRLAIARALLKDAPILILDEATSALDNESERHIQAALETLMQGRTTFVIAHRLSTIENADQILVMQEGEIVESGKHDELLELDQYYAKLHKKQFAPT
ncbi:MAG: lipid A export permease/ATP-binding protein MsbA [Gammaproteobacteria bacterium]|jgi:ATP-binding cassette, subfamily B, bacterial MsbA|nr:lipid A export permease/ATP-binding protein MsbA [Gammaproteobacteria bacterium]